VKAVPPLEGGNRESVGKGGRQGKKERARRTEEQSQAGGKFHERKNPNLIGLGDWPTG
jgi:hypothetical protein